MKEVVLLKRYHDTLIQVMNCGVLNKANVSFDMSICKVIREIDDLSSGSPKSLPLGLRLTNEICRYVVNKNKYVPMEAAYYLTGILIRGVNSICDQYQNHEGLQVASVLNLAKLAGLPLFLVDLRHKATHGDLPTLEMLEFGTESILSYLRNTFWEVVEEDFKKFESFPSECAKLFQSLSQSKKTIQIKEVARKIRDACTRDNIEETLVPALINFLVEARVQNRTTDDFFHIECLVAILDDEFDGFCRKLFRGILSSILEAAPRVPLSRLEYWLNYLLSERWMKANDSEATSGHLISFNRECFPSYLFWIRKCLAQPEEAEQKLLFVLVPKFYQDHTETLLKIANIVEKYHALKKLGVFSYSPKPELLKNKEKIANLLQSHDVQVSSR